jgi:TetR/AcrR family transcriptional regulator, mexJK operon transcriptional repressor
MSKTDSSKNYTPRAKGRKRGELFFDAATRAFVRDGYERMSLKDLVAETGGSMTTLYQIFGNKEKLFQAVIDSKYDAIYADVYAFDLDGLSLDAALQKVGQSVMKVVTSDEAIDLYRMIVVENERLPHLRQSFIEKVLHRGKQALAEFLAAEAAAGRVEIVDATAAAAEFFGMVRQDFVVRLLLGEDLKLDSSAQDKIVNDAIATFLYGTRPR